MNKDQETITTWNKMANLYQEKFMDMNIYDATYDCFLGSLTASNAAVLDLGCGPGNITKYLLSKNSDLDITGVDVAENMIDLAKKNNPTAKFFVMDIRHLKSLQRFFDGVVCGFAIPFLSAIETRQLFSQVYEMLNMNGFFYLSFVDGEPSKSDYKTNREGDRIYFQYHELTTIIANLKQLKFTILNQFTIPYPSASGLDAYHTVIIARKMAKK